MNIFNGVMIIFNCKIIEVKTNLSRANDLVDKAFKIINGDIPESNENCDYCKWNRYLMDL